MQYTWNGNDGSYTDATQWTPEDVPLYGSSDSAVIQSGTATLSNTAPNNIAIFLGGTNAATAPDLVLNNAALGSDARLYLFQPITNRPLGYATITIQGYDTNYGLIDNFAQPFTPEAVTIAIAPYSQFNQEGVISVGPAPTLQVTGSGDAPATLNNDGAINVNGGSIAISTDVIGSGTIAFASPPGGPYGSGLVELGKGVSSSQHISFASPGGAGNLRIDDPLAFHGVIDGFAAPYSSITVANTQATGAYFAQITPDAGALLLLNGQQVVDTLTVTGAHASNSYGVSSNADGSTTITPVYPTPTTS